MTRRFALCADDFGLTAPISEGIAALAHQGRLNLISCMSTPASWLPHAALLRDLPASVETGLHVNLSEGEPGSAALRQHWARFPSLPQLIGAAHLGRLPLAAIAQECDWQWQRHVDATGRAPTFVDGHQHVHHLPGVRDVIVQLARQHGLRVRNTARVLGPGYTVKRWLIAHTGGVVLQGLLRRHGIAHNHSLLGVYDFQQPDVRALMQGWLRRMPDQGGLVFCHPAAPGAADGIGPARQREAAYLASAAFAEDLQAAGFSLGSPWTESSSGC